MMHLNATMKFVTQGRDYNYMLDKSVLQFVDNLYILVGTIWNNTSTNLIQHEYTIMSRSSHLVNLKSHCNFGSSIQNVVESI